MWNWITKKRCQNEKLLENITEARDYYMEKYEKQKETYYLPREVIVTVDGHRYKVQ